MFEQTEAAKAKKFCYNCIHRTGIIEEGAPDKSGCCHPVNVSRQDMVSGRFISYSSLWQLRAENANCGPEGKLFEPKVDKADPVSGALPSKVPTLRGAKISIDEFS